MSRLVRPIVFNLLSLLLFLVTLIGYVVWISNLASPLSCRSMRA